MRRTFAISAVLLAAITLALNACAGNRLSPDTSAYGSQRQLTKEELAQLTNTPSPGSVTKPGGATTYFAPFGSFSTADLMALQDFAKGLSVTVKILPASPMPDTLFDSGQVVGERMIAALNERYPDRVNAEGSTVIGFTTEDMRLDSRPEWAWAFGLRDENLGVIATRRMMIGTAAGSSLYDARLRKMTGRYVGLLSLDLTFNADPTSMLYADLLGVDDLDRMRERF